MNANADNLENLELGAAPVDTLLSGDGVAPSSIHGGAKRPSEPIAAPASSSSLAPDRRQNNNISRRFWEKLSAHPYFQSGDNWQLIAPCWRLVSKIYNKSVYYETSGAVEIHSLTIKDLFKGCSVPYARVLEVLVSMGVLEIDHSYLPAKYCKTYAISEEVRQFVREDVEDYVNTLHRNKELRRKVAKAKSMKKTRYKAGGDMVVDSNFKMLHWLKYKPADYEAVVNKLINDPSLKENERKFGAENVKLSIKRLVSGDFEVKRYDADGRMHNPYNQMHKVMRNLLFIQEPNSPHPLRNLFDIDFRAMHPTFLGIYLSEVAGEYVVLKSKERYLSNYNTYYGYLLSIYPYPYASYPFIPSYPSYPIVGENVDSLSLIPVDKIRLRLELERWNTFWTAPDDPREAMAQRVGKTKAQVKQALLVDLNEKRGYSTPFKDWMKQEFPILYGIWRGTDVSRTGCNLSKFYESELLRTPEFYEFAESFDGIRILCCHDGVSVFASEEDPEAEAKAGQIRDFLVELSYRKFGIRPVVKLERVQRPDYSQN